MVFDLATLLRPNIAKLVPYRCARDDFKEGILLDANENTHGFLLAQQGSVPADSLELNRYPDPHQEVMKTQIAAFRNRENGGGSIGAANMVLGVGLDESIDALMRAFGTPGKDKVLVCPPTYGMYSICANVNDLEVVKVPLTTPDFQVDVAGVLAAVQADPSIKLVYVTSPGNPTAKLVDWDLCVRPLVEQCARVWNGLVVVDEAYIDFCPEGTLAAPKVTHHPNLVVLQTLSKLFGLAGVRLGVTFALEEIARVLNLLKYPYNILVMAADIGERATTAGAIEGMRKTVDTIKAERAWLLEQVSALPGIGANIGGSDANFLLMQVVDASGAPSNAVAEAVYNTMATQLQVVVRFRGKEANCTGALRLTVGTHAENVELVRVLAATLAAARA